MGHGQPGRLLQLLEPADQIKRPRRREAGGAKGMRYPCIPIIPYINKTIKGRFL